MLNVNYVFTVDSNIHQLNISRVTHTTHTKESNGTVLAEGSLTMWKIKKCEWKELSTSYLHLPTQICPDTPIVSPSTFGLDMAALLQRCQHSTKTSGSDLTLIPLLPSPVEEDDEDDDDNDNDNDDKQEEVVDEGKNEDQKIMNAVVETHTVILAARSQRLHAMLTSGMRESREGKVVMESMAHDILLELVRFPKKNAKCKIVD